MMMWCQLQRMVKRKLEVLRHENICGAAGTILEWNTHTRARLIPQEAVTQVHSSAMQPIVAACISQLKQVPRSTPWQISSFFRWAGGILGVIIRPWLRISPGAPANPGAFPLCYCYPEYFATWKIYEKPLQPKSFANIKPTMDDTKADYVPLYDELTMKWCNHNSKKVLAWRSRQVERVICRIELIVADKWG